MLVRTIRKILDTPKVLYKKCIFKKNAKIVGMDHTFGKTSNCINGSGDKNNIVIGENCEIEGCLVTQNEGKISIGKNTTIRYNSIIGAVENVCIGDYVIISNNVTIYDNNNHPTGIKERKNMSLSGFHSELWKWKYSEHKPIIIGDNVWIGEKATILKGVSIGEGAIVASNAVVTHDVEARSIVAGNPARDVKKI